MVNEKKKILFQSDFSLAKTGFGRASRALLTYLYNTNKYEITHYCCGLQYSNPELKKTPWKSIGVLPDSREEIENLNEDNAKAKMATYGALYIDKVIRNEKPDVYIASQDIWGIDFAVEKKWFNKITSVLWTTLDSLPILPSAIEKAPNVKNYWIWSDFATKAMQKKGLNHVKTMHGPIEIKNFFKLEIKDKINLRKKFAIDDNAFIIGFVFRNQLRKSVPNLLEGYSLWKQKNKNVKSFLLLHTSWNEGWNIKSLAEQYHVPLEEILTTYVCKNCGEYEIKRYSGQDLNCCCCNAQKACSTTSVSSGVSEKHLNEIYNLMDVYCHPFTSGGQEIPIQEAKLTELITLVTDYSCGEEMCAKEAHSLPLNWSSYREHGTEFIKASTCPKSIMEQINKVFLMDNKQKKEWGEKAREWTIENFSIEKIGKKIESFIDESPFIENKEEIFSEILNEEEKEFDISQFLDKEDEGKRVLYIVPENEYDVFLSTSLFKSIKETYPKINLYYATKPEYFNILNGNKYIHKIIPYNQKMEDIISLEGRGDNPGYFELVFYPKLSINNLNYIKNGKSILNIK